MESYNIFFEGFISLFEDPRMILMWIISGLLLYLGISKKKEPLLLIPISMGILFANLPLGELIKFMKIMDIQEF